MKASFDKILLTFWIGAMWSVGLIVAPTLFSLLESKVLAGNLAGQMFSIIYYLSIFSLLYFLLRYYFTVAQKPIFRRALFWVLLAMLLAMLIQLFVLQPLMADLRAGGLVGENKARFGMLHGIAWLLYLLDCVLAFYVLLKWRSTNKA